MAHADHQPGTPKYPIESVDRALQLLLALAERRSLSVSEASRLLGVAPSTAHRLLSMLLYRGFLEQAGPRADYTAGPAMLQVARSMLRSVDLRSVAREPLSALAHELGETAQVAVLQGGDILFVEGVEGGYALRAGSRVGETRPAHCTAAGRAILFTLGDDRLERMFPGEALPQETPASISQREALFEELEVSRLRGYALNLGEAEQHLHAVAAPISGATEQAWASVTVAAPSYRLSQDRAVQIASKVIATAEEIAQGLL